MIDQNKWFMTIDKVSFEENFDALGLLSITAQPIFECLPVDVQIKFAELQKYRILLAFETQEKIFNKEQFIKVMRDRNHYTQKRYSYSISEETIQRAADECERRYADPEQLLQGVDNMIAEIIKWAEAVE